MDLLQTAAALGAEPEGIVALDRQLTLWINSLNSPWTDQFWIFMSLIKIWFPMYAVIIGLLIWRLGWKKGLICVACVALAFFFNERINNLIKALVERPRPCNDPGMIAAGIHILEEGGGWSFPSGHACNCFGLACSTFPCFKMDRRCNWTWYGVFIFVWATLVGISRIMVARHFLGDVLTGAVMGSAMGIAWYFIAKALCARITSGETLSED